MKTQILLSILNQPRALKRLFALALDIGLGVFTIWLLFCLRLEQFVGLSELPVSPFLVAIGVGLPLFLISDFYQVIIRYSGWSVLKTLSWVGVAYGLLYAMVFTVIGVGGVPRSIGITQPLLWLLSMAAWRASVSRAFFDYLAEKKTAGNVHRVLIYGAGSAGRQLALGLQHDSEMVVVGFIDDDPTMQNNLINNLPIYSQHALEELIPARKIDTVLLALPSLSRARRHQIVESLLKYQISVRTLPGLEDLAFGKVTVNDLRELDITDLLGRDPVHPNQALLHKKILSKVVLVTGAGGSIGSELCRQILALSPSRLILVDNSEYALYTIHSELETHLSEEQRGLIVPLLASVCDESRMSQIFEVWQPETVYHAAAYKHVPLVEANPTEGIRNNVLGTLNVASLSASMGVADFVLISTDKAVRPTNVMGASKRLAEMLIQSLASKSTQTCFSMVRFGNVLGSSGSVIPRFRQQIMRGGPITLTHQDIIRYFMTIPEAVQLVIQAGAMAQGGEVFVLDMGDPIRIYDLAERMIKLSGLTLKNESNPEGDIEIQITGLRPGEKLFEELLIEEGAKPSKHPRILVANEPYLKGIEESTRFEELRVASSQNNAGNSVALLNTLIGLWPEDGHQNLEEVA